MSESYGMLDDSLDILGDIKFEGVSESESSSGKPESGKQTPVDPLEGYSLEKLLPKPMFHPPSGPPYCTRCSACDHQIYFSTKCQECEQLLNNASIPEIFGIMRQWSSETQSQLMLYLEKLFQLGCGVCDYDTVSGCTPLHFAIRSGSKNVGSEEMAARCTQYLLDHGANIHMRDLWTGMMPLHYAAFFNVPSVVSKLLTHRSLLEFDVNYPCEEFDEGTALHIASMNLSYESAKVLLEHGASVELKNSVELKPKEVIPEEDINDPDSSRSQLIRKIHKLLESFEEKESISVPNYDDVHGKALLLAMKLTIGDNVVINNEKTGRLMFCGRVEFAGGVWAGVELSKGEGKNDGSVAGITYFKCPAGSGVFVPITKISKPGKVAKAKSNRLSLDVSYSKPDLSNITSKINTGRKSVVGQTKATEPPSSCLSRSNSICSDVGESRLMEGDRVVVGGYKKGIIRYKGETKFAPGEWYGVELDRPLGKNDGCVDGVRYFACKPKYGLFCTTAKLRRAPLTRASSNESLNSINSLNQDSTWTMRVKKLSGGHRSASTSIGSLNSSINDGASGTSTPRQRSRSSSLSRLRSSPSKSKRSSDYKLEKGMTVLFNNDMAVVKYIGAVSFADGCWLGLELKSPSGKNDGSVQGERYFTCKSKHGVMVRPSRVSVKGINGAKLLGDQYQNLNTSKLDSSDQLLDSKASEN